MSRVDFSLIFRPALPSRARAYGDGHTVHDSGRTGNLHFFHHLDAWKREIAAGEVHRAQPEGHVTAAQRGEKDGV